ncbi:hypothetical protein PG985_015014 [Apiospora marii]|uniref:Methyltransferase domain-containing protein n=1 Tax=Apiospora marii TaxID=335849 RepID=A0ABR1RKR3_9PEZI
MAQRSGSGVGQITCPLQAAEYLKHAGRTASALVAHGLVRLPLGRYNAKTHILDSACGPGIVTKLLLSSSSSPQEVHVPGLPLSPPPRVVGIDISADMVASYVGQKETLGWGTAEAFVQDAGDLACFADQTFDAIIMNLGLFMVPDPAHCATEMHRVLKPGGHLVVTTWKRAGVHHLIQKVVDAIHGPGRQNVLPIPPEWTTSEKLVRVLRSGGFDVNQEAHIRAEAVKWQVESVEEIVEHLSAPHWMDKHCSGWSEDDKVRWKGEIVNQLSEEERATSSVSMIGWVCVVPKAEE